MLALMKWLRTRGSAEFSALGIALILGRGLTLRSGIGSALAFASSLDPGFSSNRNGSEFGETGSYWIVMATLSGTPVVAMSSIARTISGLRLLSPARYSMKSHLGTVPSPFGVLLMPTSQSRSSQSASICGTTVGETRRRRPRTDADRDRVTV